MEATFFMTEDALKRVMPVVEVDGTAIGTGKPGPVAARMREIYLDEMRKTAV